MKRLKRQATDWEKISANDVSDKELVSRICNEVPKLNSKKRNSPIRKWAKYINRHFTEEGIQMANKHKKRYSISIAAREM